MKGLITTMAAIAAGVCCADVTSANIVGYQAVDVVEDGSGMFAMTFEGVGADGKIDIQDIVPASTEAGEYIGDGSYDFQTVLPSGIVDEHFYYRTKLEDTVPADGWYKGTDMENLADKKFSIGDGVWYYSYWKDSTMRFSGQVEMEAIDIPLVADGSGIFGIARPIDINIQDIVPHSEEAGEYVGDGSYDFQTVQKTGIVDEHFYYRTKLEDTVPADGWYKGTEMETLSDKVIDAGSGLWYYSYWGKSYFRLKAVKDEIAK